MKILRLFILIVSLFAAYNVQAQVDTKYLPHIVYDNGGIAIFTYDDQNRITNIKIQSSSTGEITEDSIVYQPNGIDCSMTEKTYLSEKDYENKTTATDYLYETTSSPSLNKSEKRLTITNKTKNEEETFTLTFTSGKKLKKMEQTDRFGDTHYHDYDDNENLIEKNSYFGGPYFRLPESSIFLYDKKTGICKNINSIPVVLKYNSVISALFLFHSGNNFIEKRTQRKGKDDKIIKFSYTYNEQGYPVERITEKGDKYPVTYIEAK